MRTIAIAAVAALYMLAPMQAHAVGECIPPDKVAASLERDWGEVPVAEMVTVAGNRAVLYANQTTGTFTIYVQAPGVDIACNAQEGQGFTLLPLNQPSPSLGPPA